MRCITAAKFEDRSLEKLTMYMVLLDRSGAAGRRCRERINLAVSSLKQDSLFVERVIVFFPFPRSLPEAFLSHLSLIHTLYDSLILGPIQDE